MFKQFTNSLIFRGTEDYQHLWKRPLPKEYFKVKSEGMRKVTLQKSLSESSGAACLSHSHTFTIYLVKLRLLRVQAHSYSIAPETFRQIISAKMSCTCFIVLKDTGCALAKKSLWDAYHTWLLGNRDILVCTDSQNSIFIKVYLSTVFLVQNIPEIRKGESII